MIMPTLPPIPLAPPSKTNVRRSSGLYNPIIWLIGGGPVTAGIPDFVVGGANFPARRTSGPFYMAGPVNFQPSPSVTDDLDSFNDLSNGEDIDAPENRSLVIRWAKDPAVMDLNDLKEFHVYVQMNGEGEYTYLGSTRSPDSELLEWKETTSAAFNERFRSGPQPGNSYCFKVYALTNSQTPLFYGPFQTQGPVSYQ